MRAGERDWVLSELALLLLLLIGGSFVVWHNSHDPGPGDLPSHRVTATAKGLQLDGKAWWPTGFNAYQLGTDWSLNVGCGAQVDLDQYFDALPPRSLTRFSLFAPFTQRKDNGKADFSRIDDVFAAATRHDQLVLPVLAAGDGSCDGEKFRDHDFYTGGWKTAKESVHGTYADWVRTAVDRWKDEPMLVGWTAMGEAEPGVCGTGDCKDYRNRTCPADATAVLRTFFDETGALIRSIDSTHLLFAGLTGGGQCGTAGDQYATVGASDGIDVLEYHDYTLTDPVPDTESIPARIEQATKLGKPLFVAELGYEGGSCRPLDERASALRARIEELRGHGVAGVLAWSYVPDPRPSECTLDIGPGDPLWPSLV
ncbi:MAG: beta-mannosidase [Gordonia sp. (in: high G+C Gram-positive bacteria)]|uniref:beta-mannosidase n=1 Tax=Gordonia sp. (in: high G+C Gram-positive bacteria) TaxID=84139 RepID=UPI0039E5EFCE